MSTKAIRATLSGLAIIPAFIAVMYTTVAQDAVYYKHVNEVMNAPDQWYGKPMQLHGFVVEKSILQRPNTMDYRFKIKTDEYSVVADYTGIVPDTFKDGAEVVLSGRLGPEGFKVDPNGVTAKCPSKYEAAGPSGSAIR
jgi:cytochrome c-type biogenesis protein CcmE